MRRGGSLRSIWLLLAMTAVPMAAAGDASAPPPLCQEGPDCLGESMRKELAARGVLGLALEYEQTGDRGASAVFKVTGLKPDSPATHQGFILGDRIAAVDGRPVASTDDVEGVVEKTFRDIKPGQRVSFTVDRNGQKRSIALDAVAADPRDVEARVRWAIGRFCGDDLLRDYVRRHGPE